MDRKCQAPVEEPVAFLESTHLDALLLSGAGTLTVLDANPLCNAPGEPRSFAISKDACKNLRDAMLSMCSRQTCKETVLPLVRGMAATGVTPVHRKSGSTASRHSQLERLA